MRITLAIKLYVANYIYLFIFFSNQSRKQHLDTFSGFTLCQINSKTLHINGIRVLNTHVSMIRCTSKRSWSLHTCIHTYICREACSGEQTTEGALHDLNYPEMQEAEEERRRRPFNRMSQSKNPLAQPLICTSSASEGSGTTDMYTYTPCTYSRVRLWSTGFFFLDGNRPLRAEDGISNYATLLSIINRCRSQRIYPGIS